MNNLDTALKSIIKQDYLRPWSKKPFLIGNDVYATDCHTIIKTSKKNVDGLYEQSNNTQHIDKRILEMFEFSVKEKTLINIKDIENAIKQIPLVDEVTNETKEGKCNECYGTGEVQWEYEGHYNDFDCPVCDGNGTLIESQKTKTGNKIKDENYFIDINNTRIRSCMIDELISVSKIMKKDNIYIIHNSKYNKYIAFGIGELQILMMPVLHNADQKIIKIK